jgi:hypothetical protein
MLIVTVRNAWAGPLTIARCMAPSATVRRADLSHVGSVS